MAVGMTFVIITGGIDLTVGSVFGLAGVVIGICLQSNVSLAISILLGLLTGVLVGALNGLAITKIGLPPFIVTLSLMNITRGMAQGFTSGSPIKIPDSLKALAIGDFIGITLPAQLLSHILQMVNVSLFSTSPMRHAASWLQKMLMKK